MKKLFPPQATLDPEEINNWNSILKKYIWDIYNWELAAHEVEKDNSSSLTILSRRSVVRLFFPCPITVLEIEDMYVLMFQLGQGKYQFVKSENKTNFSDILINAGKTWHETYDPASLAVWSVIKKHEPRELYYPYSMLERALGEGTLRKSKNLKYLRTKEFDKIGYWIFNLKKASGEADIRIDAISRMNNHKLTPEDLKLDMINCSKLILNCPEHIEQIIHRARLLYVNGFVEWDFFTIAEHYAVLSLEASLRAVYEKWLGNEPVTLEAQLRESKVVQKMKPDRELIYDWSVRENAKNVKVNGLPFPRNKEMLLEHAYRISCLSKWEQKRCRGLLQLRDIHSHPDSHQIIWISHVQGHISEVCLLINLMWVRFSLGIRKEYAYDISDINY